MAIHSEREEITAYKDTDNYDHNDGEKRTKSYKDLNIWAHEIVVTRYIHLTAIQPVPIPLFQKCRADMINTHESLSRYIRGCEPIR